MASGLSLATTKRLIDELISQGMIAELSPGDERHGRGRRASSLDLAPSFGFSIGASIEPGALTVVAIGFDGGEIYRREIRTETYDREALQKLFLDEAEKAREECSSKMGGSFLGVGVGIAGLVNTREGTILYCPGLPGWENVPLGTLVASRFGAPVVIDDAVRCMALAEKRYGERRDLDTFLFIYVGRGVGAGIILDNRIYRGKNGICGEFGHMTVRENGPLCSCGNRGCLEALVSSKAIVERVRQLLLADVYSTLHGEGDLSLAGICSAADEGDKLANMVIAETEECIGVGVANLINIFDPGIVILAGEVIESFLEPMVEGVRRTVRRRALHAITQKTTISRSCLDGSMAARGAATLMIERFLENEIVNL